MKGNLIENVKSVNYLGFTIGETNGNLNGTLASKQIGAIFALNNRIKLSRLPPWLALKIFNTQIIPIILYLKFGALTQITILQIGKVAELSENIRNL